MKRWGEDPHLTAHVTGFFSEPLMSDGEMKALMAGPPAESAEERIEADRRSIDRQFGKEVAWETALPSLS